MMQIEIINMGWKL